MFQERETSAIGVNLKLHPAWTDFSTDFSTCCPHEQWISRGVLLPCAIRRQQRCNEIRPAGPLQLARFAFALFPNCEKLPIERLSLARNHFPICIYWRPWPCVLPIVLCSDRLVGPLAEIARALGFVQV